MRAWPCQTRRLIRIAAALVAGAVLAVGVGGYGSGNAVGAGTTPTNTRGGNTTTTVTEPPRTNTITATTTVTEPPRTDTVTRTATAPAHTTSINNNQTTVVTQTPTSSGSGDSGLPAWAWILIGVGAVAIALMTFLAGRHRGASERDRDWEAANQATAARATGPPGRYPPPGQPTGTDAPREPPPPGWSGPGQ